MSKSMNVMVTGATGLLGKSIVIKLIEAGHEVVEVGSQRTIGQSSRFETDEFYSVDISDAKEVRELLIENSIDVFIHSAGLAHQFGDVSLDDFFRINVTGTANACDLAKTLGAKQFILISSVSVYGSSEKGLVDETFDCKPTGAYAKSKLESEKIAVSFCERNDISLTILRPATVIGEGDPGNVRKLISTIANGRFVWVGRGENLKSLVYKDDVALACLSVLGQKGNNVFNISAEPVKMKMLVELIERLTGKSALPIVIPTGFALWLTTIGCKIGFKQRSTKLRETIDKWIADDAYSSEKLRKHINFEPQTSIESGITREVEWYLKNCD